jgi:hypothetical protein
LRPFFVGRIDDGALPRTAVGGHADRAIGSRLSRQARPFPVALASDDRGQARGVTRRIGYRPSAVGQSSMPIGNERMRIRASSSTTTDPRSKASSSAGRFAREKRELPTARPRLSAPATSRSPCRPRYHPVLVAGADEDRFVIRSLQTILPNVDCIVSTLPQSLSNHWRQSVVHQEPHGTVRGNARSRTASAANCNAS